MRGTTCEGERLCRARHEDATWPKALTSGASPRAIPTLLPPLGARRNSPSRKNYTAVCTVKRGSKSRERVSRGRSGSRGAIEKRCQ